LNRTGQLGDGSALDKSVPTAIGTLKTWFSVSAGEFHTAALLGASCVTAGCPLYAWGFNQNGQLGDGTNIDIRTPTKIGKDTNWISIAAGRSHTLAVKKDGTLWAWGRNFSAQIGDGSQLDRAVPTAIGTLVPSPKAWKAVAAGESHSVGIQNDGTVFTWGTKESGQTGQGAGNPSIPVTLLDFTPTAITLSGAAVQFVGIAAGSNHTLAIRNNGTLYAWGLNDFGQLGDGGNTPIAFDPIQVGTDADWTVVSAGAAHSMAIKSDGSLWAWGANTYGQLGDGTDADANVPKQIGTEKKWVFVSAGKYHTFAIKTDGTLWGWGRNQEGQLGNGLTGTLAQNVLVPTQLK